jgi:hypothetical protein
VAPAAQDVDPATELGLVLRVQEAGAVDRLALGEAVLGDRGRQDQGLDGRARLQGQREGPVDPGPVGHIAPDRCGRLAHLAQAHARLTHRRQYLAAIDIHHHRRGGELLALLGPGRVVLVAVLIPRLIDRQPHAGVEQGLDIGLELHVDGQDHVGAGDRVELAALSRIQGVDDLPAGAAQHRLAGALDAPAADAVAGEVAGEIRVRVRT